MDKRQNNTINNVKNFIVTSATTIPTTADTIYVNNVISLNGSGITFTGDIIPKVDNIYDIGKPNFRYRQINTVNGNSTRWNSTLISANTITADTIDLGYDEIGQEQRILNKYTSVLKNDLLSGGSF